MRDYVVAQALHEAEALVADAADVDFLALALPGLVLVQRHTQQVRVERAAQALVGGDDDQAHALHGVARHQEGVAVFRVGVADVRGDVADLLAIGPRMPHALLRLAHFRGGDHLHRLGDLPSVLHTLDFDSYFFCAWHDVSAQRVAQYEPFFFQSAIASLSFFSSSAGKARFSSMRLMRSAYLPLR